MNVQIQNYFWCEMIINSIDYTNNPYLHDSTKQRLKHKQSAFYENKSDLIKTRDNNEEINSGNFTDKSEVAALSFKGNHVNKLLGSKNFSKFLQYAQDNNMATNAFVALITAGIIRPTLTMAIPGMKDKKDKIYSAAQAVSSGFLGFGVTWVMTKPLDDAFKKVSDDPDKYNVKFLSKMKKNIKELGAKAETASGEELKNLKQQQKTLELLVKNMPEWAICIPRAMLTIALIPLILKYVFGLSKTPKNAQQANAQPQDITRNNYNDLKNGKDLNTFLAINENKAKDVSFHGNPSSLPLPVVTKKPNKYYDKFTDFVANHFTAPILNWKWLQKASDKYKDSDFLFNHMSTVTSAVISSVYMQRTLTNNNLEEDKKKVLAVNQGLTFLISTIASYALDDKLENWWQRVTAKFIGVKSDDKEFANNFNKAQAEVAQKIKNLKKNKASKAELKEVKPLKALDYAKEVKLYMPENMETLVKGMGLLKKMTVIGSIFRLAVPVLVTPLASILSEKYLEHKRAKKAA